MDRSARPSVGGYLIAYAVSVACFAAAPVLAAGVMIVPSEPDAIGAVGAALVVYLVYASICSLPFALVGIPLVHVLSRPCETQAGQVVITGAVTLVVVAVPIAWIVGSLGGGLALGAGAAVATMIGRASLIPFAPGTDVGVSRPREREQP